MQYTMGLSIIYLKGSQIEITKELITSVLKIVFILANSANPDGMQHYVAFHLGLLFLPKYWFRGFQYTMG